MSRVDGGSLAKIKFSCFAFADEQLQLHYVFEDEPLVLQKDVAIGALQDVQFVSLVQGRKKLVSNQWNIVAGSEGVSISFSRSFCPRILSTYEPVEGEQKKLSRVCFELFETASKFRHFDFVSEV